jgi:hypothetical protein
LWTLQTPHRLAGLQKEDVIVIDLPGGLELCAKTKLPFQNQEGTGAQLDATVVSGLCIVSVHSRDPRLVDADDPVHNIEVRESKRDFLRGP